MKTKRLFVMGLIIFLVSSVFSFRGNTEAAEQYPVKPITLIVTVEAGGGGDLAVRPVCLKVSTLLGKPIVIVNKPGAGGALALREIHDAKPDGYTIGLANATIVSNKLAGILPYDYRDFTVLFSNHFNYASLVASTKTQRPFKTIQEVLSFAKSHPGEVRIATSGVGYIWWISTIDLQQKTGVKFNVIPVAGTGGFVTAQVAGGHTDLGVIALASIKSQIDAGAVRYLAVLGPNRAPGYDVPTIKEAIGLDVGVGSGGFVVGPPGIPKDRIDKLAKAWEVAVNDPKYQEFSAERYNDAVFMPSNKLIENFDKQREAFRTVMEGAGLLKEK
jgi:tripartite-type tricarboxylate transporter receptor subunit TctC